MRNEAITSVPPPGCKFQQVGSIMIGFVSFVVQARIMNRNGCR
jgi:hypothetical protein